MLNLVLQPPWQARQDALTGPGEGDRPEWWPPSLSARWHAWTGVAGTLYARMRRSSPPRVVRAQTPGELAAAAAHAETCPPWACRNKAA